LNILYFKVQIRVRDVTVSYVRMTSQKVRVGAKNGLGIGIVIVNNIPTLSHQMVAAEQSKKNEYNRPNIIIIRHTKE